jgi:hypothetical protein
MNKRILPLLSISLLLVACSSQSSNNKIEDSPERERPGTDYVAYKTSSAINIDGIANEKAWEEAEWNEIDHRWLGEPYSEDDFQGRFKLSWDDDYLYLMAEITDDALVEMYEGTDQYWNDDILEVFVDEDLSGGDHQYNYNAFAYHIDTNYDVFDLGTDRNPHYFNDHVEVKYGAVGTTYTWEVAIKVYDDTFVRDQENTPVTLSDGKQMGLAVAYCDNDNSQVRENFIGSEVIEGEDKNRAWIDASIFGSLQLVE